MSLTNDTIPYGFCHCGCGQKTKLAPQTDSSKSWIKGQPKKYVLGHNGRKGGPAYVVDQETGCHRWQGWVSPSGYGRLGANGVFVQAHVFFYEKQNGPVPAGMVLDHVYARGCRYRDCINPDHMEPVTEAENIRRGKNTKLTWDKVREIRAVGRSRTLQQQADKFGVDQSLISRILLGRSWKDTELEDALEDAKRMLT